MNRADETHFSAALNQEIVMNLDWEVPETGHWDGFVVTYSPFISMPENSDFMPPFSYGAGRTNAKINLPRTDQKYTVSIFTRCPGMALLHKYPLFLDKKW